MPNDDQGLILNGLDGSNPLGFLAAVGVLRVLSDVKHSHVRLAWRDMGEGWRAQLYGFDGDRAQLCAALLEAIKECSTAVFEIGKENAASKRSNKFPFDAGKFRAVMKTEANQPSGQNRRELDLLAAFGTDWLPDKKTGLFQCTELKMVRSGDSKGQGMLSYAKSIHDSTDYHKIERALFFTWDYQDKGASLRWDPLEDQRHALRHRDPSKSSLADGPASMMAANCLAVEALRSYPVIPSGYSAQTTGFLEKDRQKWFVWPIWKHTLDIEIVRSLLSLRVLYETPIRRRPLAARGIAEVYGALLVRPNQYYINFAPALPIE